MPLRRFLLTLSVPVVLIILGTIGYGVIEGWPLFDALYMTVITITTVGFREIHPLTTAGAVFTMLLALGGIFTLFAASAEIIRWIVSGEVRRALGRQWMERSLSEIEDHIVVCGFGRLGRHACQEFSQQSLPFVIVDRDPITLQDFSMPNGIALVGDATSDDVLRRAGVERARVLLAVAASDAENVFITMSARLMSERLFIVVRAEEDGAEKKLLRAGANRVISPYTIAGHRMAEAAVRPNVVDFIELATKSENLELQIEETRVGAGSVLAGATLRDSRVRQELGLIVVAIRKADGRMVYNPPSDEIIGTQDLLITLGPR